MADDLARDAAELFTVRDDAPGRLLHRLTEVAARRIAGCSGATASLWDADEVVATAASHPDVAALAERQFVIGEGPIISALRGDGPSVTDDTVREARWPDFGAAALAAGVRSSVTLMHDFGSMSVSLSLYGVRTGAFDLEKLPVASLLAAFGAAVMAGAQRYGSARRTAAQLEEAIQSRAVVDQAKGVLMQALGCGPDEAFERLRRISQTQHIKLTEVAAKVVENRAEPG